MLSIADLKIAVIGLGYVGLPLAVEFGKKVPVVGFDIYQNELMNLKVAKTIPSKFPQKNSNRQISSVIQQI